MDSDAQFVVGEDAMSQRHQGREAETPYFQQGTFGCSIQSEGIDVLC
jgi:hypothetical protein